MTLGYLWRRTPFLKETAMGLATLVRFGAVQFVACFAAASLAIAADTKAPGGRLAAGDLAEFTSGLGPMIGEVIGGPDASGYYQLLVPRKGEVPINGNKLRLVQRNGAPDAAFKPGDIVDVRTGPGQAERVSIVKVKGAWCQIQAPLLAGWEECKDLRVVKRAGGGQGAEQARPEEDTKSPGTASAAAAAKPANVAGSSLRGTYQNADGSVQIEFLPGTKAFWSLQGATMECTHKQNGKKVVLSCDGDDVAFSVNDDGSLAGPPDSLMTRMKKKS